MNNTTHIYLVENCNGDASSVYIGKSKLPAERKKRHKVTFGRDIRFTIIDSVDSLEEKYWQPLEQYWIQQFISWGFNVQNKNKNGGGGPSFLTEEQRKASGAVHVDKINSQETKDKMAAAARNREKVACTYCGAIVAINTVDRWHNENCKHKGIK